MHEITLKYHLLNIPKLQCTDLFYCLLFSSRVHAMAESGLFSIFRVTQYQHYVQGVTDPHTPHHRRLLTLDHHLDGAARPGLGRLERVEGLLQREPVRDQRLDVNLHIN